MPTRHPPKQSTKSHPTPHAKAYPRPMLQRTQWINLNGQWEFAIDNNAQFTHPSEVKFPQTITVPFAPETPASGVNNTAFYKAVWYRKDFTPPALAEGERLILHFGAVDYQARVWVNDQLAVEHEGGYTPFKADITDLLSENGAQTIALCASDDPHDLAKPRGKQDWLLDAHSIWYPRTTGIWQTVWMEVVPVIHVESLRWTPRFQDWQIQLDASFKGRAPAESRLRVQLSSRGQVLVDDIYSIGPELRLSRCILLPDPGIDDARNALFWWPHAPNLIEAKLTLQDDAGNILDEVASYTALRGVSALGGKFFLNGRPYKLEMVLDQGYWPDTGLSAPDDHALRRDVELLKEMGFNGVRKHQKIEDPRFLYWADHLGLLVWGEMPSAYTFSHQTVERVTRQWTEAIVRDASHPCIVAWVPINESWGVPDLPQFPAQRAFVANLYNLTKALDPTRLCIGNDGWEAVPHAGDILAIHDYDADPNRIARRYTFENFNHLLQHETPGNKVLTLEGFIYRNQPVMLTEFGGIAFSKDHKHTWGYSRANTAEAFALRYFHLMDAVRHAPLLSGWCYTQFTDTYQEANGLLYMDRTPKFPIAEIAVATRGAQSESDQKIETTWRKNHKT